MDFSLIEKDETFDLESYFPSIIDEFKGAGRDVIITMFRWVLLIYKSEPKSSTVCI
jgi:hypothetical protein